MIDVTMQELGLSRKRLHDRARKVGGHRLHCNLRHALTIGDQQPAMALHSYQVGHGRVNRRSFSLAGWMKKFRRLAARIRKCVSVKEEENRKGILSHMIRKGAVRLNDW